MKTPFKNFLKIFKIALAAALVTFLLFTIWVMIEYNHRPESLPQDIIFEIPKGASVISVSHQLKAKGIITHPFIFRLMFQVLYPDQPIKAGEYKIKTPISIKELLQVLTQGQVLLHSITIPEGLTRFEIATLLEKKLSFFSANEFIAATETTSLIKDLDPLATNLEGYLFPETYSFPKGTSPGEVVQAMVRQFRRIFSSSWQARASQLGFSVREIVILASLIEKETSQPEERNLISAVFHNRLKKKMKLDCDPTIIYALKLKGKYDGRLGWNDLKLDSPYNTYLYPGLPPGPIANPGQAALEAALYPADVDYLYFVARNDGTHVFSRTLREHNQNVLIYQKKASRSFKKR
ncbi:endolytic transglycosylase MltG [Candidatus Aminicenantes bacterium AC-334-K16]|jgi:UPF0755 protein|nr:endolytic transglycosylase MltG [Candidatus Aminicenantes bacterium AC-334-K16]